jgi:hypothetical protein
MLRRCGTISPADGSHGFLMMHDVSPLQITCKSFYGIGRLPCFRKGDIMKFSIKRSAPLVAAAIFGSALSSSLVVPSANAVTFSFNTGNVTNSMASASRPDSAGKFEIESADDFATSTQTSITSATFTGLLTGGATTANVGAVTVEIYRVFPKDSDVGRTSGAPTFSTPQVPTRVNSPSDVEFVDRSTTSGNLSFTTSLLSPTFTAQNSVQPGGIHPMPGQTTGGNGPTTGQEVQFNITFTTPLDLPPDHYFFVPQVEVTTASGEFLWLSGTRPNPLFPAGFTDLQSWTRDQFLDPDWLRIGTDIVGGATPPTFNAAFSLDGVETPLPGALPLFASGLGALGLLGWRRKRKAAATATT